MRSRAISLIFLFALAGCKGRPKAETKESERPVQPAETTTIEEAPRHAWNISAFGLRSTEFLLPFVTDCSADGGSQRLICEVSSNGDIIRELLFIKSGSDQKTMFEVYILTYPNKLEKRKRLSTTEAETEIRRIEAVLAESGAKDQYDYFYAGGAMIEEPSIKDDNDPFSYKIPEQVDLDSEDVKRKMSEWTNQHTLISIANLVKHYRGTLRRDEQDAAGQPATRPESKPEDNKKPQTKSDGRSR